MLLDGVKDFAFDDCGFMILKIDGSLHRKAGIKSQPVKIDDIIATDCTSMKMIQKDKVAIARCNTNNVTLSILSLTGNEQASIHCDMTVDTKSK